MFQLYVYTWKQKNKERKKGMHTGNLFGFPASSPDDELNDELGGNNNHAKEEGSR